MKKRDFTLEIIQFTATVVLSLVSFAFQFPRESTFIIFSLGVSITIATILIKRELTEQLNEKLELYGSLDTIADAELRHFGYSIVNDAKKALKELNEGIVTLGAGHTFTAQINRMKSMNRGDTVFAVHPAPHKAIDYLYAWQSSIPLQNYFEENCKAIKRGVKIQRVFILEKTDWNKKATGIFQQHDHAGIEVYITWYDDIKGLDVQELDFIVFPDAVIENHSADDTARYQIIIHKDPHEIRKRLDLFETLKNRGRPLNQILTVAEE